MPSTRKGVGKRPDGDAAPVFRMNRLRGRLAGPEVRRWSGKGPRKRKTSTVRA